MLHLCKTSMYEFWYDHVKPKYGENAQICYMDTDSFIVCLEVNDICKEIAGNVETKYDN